MTGRGYAEGPIARKLTWYQAQKHFRFLAIYFCSTYLKKVSVLGSVTKWSQNLHLGNTQITATGEEYLYKNIHKHLEIRCRYINAV
jgi:hypothetical protein